MEKFCTKGWGGESRQNDLRRERASFIKSYSRETEHTGNKTSLGISPFMSFSLWAQQQQRKKVEKRAEGSFEES